MEALLACGVAFAAGWLVRSGSFREQVITLLVNGHQAVEFLRVRAAQEGEFVQDLLAEARERYESGLPDGIDAETIDPKSDPDSSSRERATAA